MAGGADEISVLFPLIFPGDALLTTLDVCSMSALFPKNPPKWGPDSNSLCSGFFGRKTENDPKKPDLSRFFQVIIDFQLPLSYTKSSS
jgi:hypothetical protein